MEEVADHLYFMPDITFKKIGVPSAWPASPQCSALFVKPNTCFYAIDGKHFKISFAWFWAVHLHINTGSVSVAFITDRLKNFICKNSMKLVTGLSLTKPYGNCGPDLQVYKLCLLWEWYCHWQVLEQLTWVAPLLLTSPSSLNNYSLSISLNSGSQSPINLPTSSSHTILVCLLALLLLLVVLAIVENGIFTRKI